MVKQLKGVTNLILIVLIGTSISCENVDNTSLTYYDATWKHSDTLSDLYCEQLELTLIGINGQKINDINTLQELSVFGNGYEEETFDPDIYPHLELKVRKYDGFTMSYFIRDGSLIEINTVEVYAKRIDLMPTMINVGKPVDKLLHYYPLSNANLDVKNGTAIIPLFSNGVMQDVLLSVKYVDGIIVEIAFGGSNF